MFTIESLIKQEFKDYEVIVIVDESTDKSVNIVLSCDDKRIRFIRKNNEHVSSARNIGILKKRRIYSIH